MTKEWNRRYPLKFCNMHLKNPKKKIEPSQPKLGKKNMSNGYIEDKDINYVVVANAIRELKPSRDTENCEPICLIT